MGNCNCGILLSYRVSLPPATTIGAQIGFLECLRFLGEIRSSELGQNRIQAALEQSRRGGHLWIFFEKPVLAKHARVYIGHLAKQLSVEVKGSGARDGIELFPKQDALDDGRFGNAIRGPLGVHRVANRRYWFFGAPYHLDEQMAYLGNLRRVTGQQMKDLIADVPIEPPAEPPRRPEFRGDRPHFVIPNHIETQRRAGRNWVAQYPSCAAAGRDRSKDNLAVSVEAPWKYICWVGCTKEQIRAALGMPVPLPRG